MKSNDAEYIKAILKRPTERDKAVRIGASNMSNACTRCLADDLLGVKKHGGPYNLGAVLGTAIHEYIEHRNLDETAGKEMKVVLGEIPGYGLVGSTTDIYREDTQTIIDLKGLALDTPLPTPTGWTTMGDVQVGDYLLDESGKPTKVIGKSEVKQLPRYRLRFDDTTEVVCDNEHRWNIVSGNSRSGWRQETVDATNLYDRFQLEEKIRIQNGSSLELSHVELPIDPYVLGVWLGDGTAAKGEIHINRSTKEGIVDEVKKRGVPIEKIVYPSDAQKSDEVVRYVFAHPSELGRGKRQSFKDQLRKLGVLGNKHIPDAYLRASHEQRLDLLRGIMDTDGSYHKKRKMVTYSTTDENMAHQVCELVNSMGWKTHVMISPVSWTHLGEKKWTTQYMLSFKPSVSPFLVRNKEVPFEKQLTVRSKYRYVYAMDKIGVGATQCVMVDSPTKTYLCSKHFVPTHNTTTREKLAGYQRVVETEPTEFDTDAQRGYRATLEQYFRQAQLYGYGVERSGKEVEWVSIVFVCRDGQVIDRDIWGYTMPYDRALAQRVFDRAKNLWAYLQTGGDVDSLTQDEHCYYCNVIRPSIVEEVEL